MTIRRALMIPAFAVYALLAACGAPEEPPVGAAGEALIACPNVCYDYGCRLKNGTCTIACNSCYCNRLGGKGDLSCGAPVAAPAPTGGSDVSAAPVPEEKPAELFGGQPCGTAVCTKGTYCCNASCSLCAPLGGSCTQQVCSSPL